MGVMQVSFDPAYGEAWTRRQVADTLLMPRTHYCLINANGLQPDAEEMAAGFTLSRCVTDEEELLLIAVSPQFRGKGLGGKLLGSTISASWNRGMTRVFLEMREHNPAERLYLRHGFVRAGRRPDYYRNGVSDPIDAITFMLVKNTAS
ncbi:GNAT family N-acetyltransferase [Altererythrobacter xixiisoli]|uniref:GNAT family N-acetyltransferase n=2 Tax=Croceibacterium xixiisoli TaxID=1476466 RepID=A0A6I4TX03_9SPHN|nr:GNAT family N-acetyltransferase [Croceibacterium xixiisoli]